MIPHALGWLYAKLGRGYARAALIAQFQLAHLVTLAGMGLLLLYQRMSDVQFWRLFAVAQGLVLIENLVSIRVVLRLLRPVEAWLDGERARESTVAAWRTLVDLPSHFLRVRKLWPLFGTILPWCAYATWELGLSPGSFPLFAAGSFIVFAYGGVLRFLGMELSLQPVLEDVARALPDRTQLPRAGVPLRWKLFALLPLINFLTGVAVAGLSENGPTTPTRRSPPCPRSSTRSVTASPT